jgi:hypothetical protein
MFKSHKIPGNWLGAYSWAPREDTVFSFI